MEFRTTALAAALLAMSTVPASAASLYGTNYTGADDLFLIDTTTGAAASVGNTGESAIGDMASDTRPSSATVWGIDIGVANQILEIDTSTGVASAIATISGAVADIISIAFDEVTGVMYGNTASGFGGGPDQLYRIDVATGVASAVGVLGFNNVFALAFDEFGDLWGVSSDTNQFLSIDTGTGLATAIGATGVSSVFDIAWDPDSDTMFASGASAGALYTADLTTGALSLVGPYANGSATNVAGLAFGAATPPVPVPAAGLLLLGALGGLGAASRRRRS